MAEVFDADELQPTMRRLADQVTRLTTDVSSLWLNEEDGPYHACLGATGFAVRASFFENAMGADSRRMDIQDETIQHLSATNAIMAYTRSARGGTGRGGLESKVRPRYNFQTCTDAARL